MLTGKVFENRRDEPGGAGSAKMPVPQAKFSG
jgi:hypothetical protein